MNNSLFLKIPAVITVACILAGLFTISCVASFAFSGLLVHMFLGGAAWTFWHYCGVGAAADTLIALASAAVWTIFEFILDRD